MVDLSYMIDKKKPPKIAKKEGHWEGWIKPSLKEATGHVTGTLETIGALASGMALWPISKAAGVGQIASGKSVEEARRVEEVFASKAYQPRTESGRGATGLVGKGFDVALTPARMAGEGMTELVGPRAGYLTELASELAMFKMAHGVGAKGRGAAKEHAIAKNAFNKKMSLLTKEQQHSVKEIAKQQVTKDLVKAEREATKPELEKAYEVQKDLWIGKKDYRVHEAEVEGRLLKKEIVETNKKLKTKVPNHKVDEAIQVYIDTKRDPSHVKKYYDQLTPEKQKIVDLSQDLPPEIKTIADKIEKSYQDIGVEAMDVGVIKNMLDDFASRRWDIRGKKKGTRKFGTTTGHAKQRRFKTIIEAWADPDFNFELIDKGATKNLLKYKEEIIKTIEDKRFIEELRKQKDLEGNPLITTKHLEGYERVEHPNFKAWEWAGKTAEEGKVYGKNFFKTDDGKLMERRELYASKKQAKNLNNILGISKLYDIPGVTGITKFNDITKAWILQTSLFHHLAFGRSYYFGTNAKKFNEMSLRQAYKEGIKAMEQGDPAVRLGVENGLTLGLKQDWNEASLRESTRIGRILNKTRASKATKDGINNFRQAQADFLFGELGAGLKAKSFMIEMRSQMKKYPDENPKVTAARVARLINDDFGGLHLQRLGRNPTFQHGLRLALLAPDWTESNVRTMVKTVAKLTGDKRDLHLYRRFWGGVIVKGLGITAVANFISAGGNVNELIDGYKQAWKDGNFNWAKINITPIYQAFGGKPYTRKYFSLLGHFQDPAKFIAHPMRSLKYKQSVVAGSGFEALSGSDWKGAKFTTLAELIEGEGTVKWGSGKSIDWEQFPSYALSQIVGWQPIQLQNFIGYTTGEIDGFDALTRSVGLTTTTTYPKKTKGLGYSKYKTYKE